MTERITPEQATLTPEMVWGIRSLDAHCDLECEEKIIELERECSRAEKRVADLEEALKVLDRIFGSEITQEPENARLLTAMQLIARTALEMSS